MSDEALEVQRSLGRIEGKFDSLLATLASRDDADQATKAELFTRVRSLEESRRKVYYTASGIGLAVGAGFQALKAWVSSGGSPPPHP